MVLTTENSGDLPNVDALAMDELLASDGFGKFAVLCASDDAFIQAGNDWQPGEPCRTFMDTHGSDPWVLEYREAGRHFRAEGHVALQQVRQAFRSYLTGESGWRTGVSWREMKS